MQFLCNNRLILSNFLANCIKKGNLIAINDKKLHLLEREEELLQISMTI